MSVRRTRSRCRRPRTRVQSRHSALTVPTHRSQNALAFGPRIGVRTILVPSDRNTSSKGSGELGVPVVDQEPHGPPLLLEGHGQVPALLGDPLRIRVACRSAEMHLPRPELDPHQHIQGLQPDGLHGEEVAGEDALGLGTQELTPRGAPPRGRTESGTVKHRGDRGCRDPDPELEKLSPYPHVAPPWVLPPQAEDQLLDLEVDGWPSGRAMRLGPLLGDEPPVPTEEGLWAY